jgi:hypothetical protein
VRRRLLRWGSWFAVANAALVALIGVRYLWQYTAPSAPVAWAYVLVATVGHWAALAYLPFLVVVAPAALLAPRPRLILPLAVGLASLGVTLTLLDSLIFAEHRYHLSLLTLSLLDATTWIFTGVYLAVIAVIETVLAAGIWRRSATPSTGRAGWTLAIVLVASFLGSHAAYLWADARYYVPVTSFTHYLPLMHRMRASALIAKLANRDGVLARGLAGAADRASGAVLRYPLAPLACAAPASSPNVLLIVIDAMRADSLTPELAPRLSAFAEGSARFEHHVSGGNASRGGMFSLFYGLPPTYWDDFASLLRPSILMDLFQQHGYQLGLFVSAPANGAVGLERTAFARVPNLRVRTRGDGPEREYILTEDWYAWLERRDPSRPFFGFLYYDMAQQQKAPEAYRRLFPRPPGASRQQAKHADYRASVHFLDSVVGDVLTDLRRRGLLEQTVVVVTSDHGTEFDETGQGFAGHGTAYSTYQLRVPLLIRRPGEPAARVTRRTSHYDIVPTVVRRLFGCTNPPSDYSSGHDLFSDAQWDWIIATSYDDFALVEPDRATVIGRTGYYEIRDADYRLIPRPRVRADVLRAAMHEMSRFYR